jgi:hypothetical protein
VESLANRRRTRVRLAQRCAEHWFLIRARLDCVSELSDHLLMTKARAIEAAASAQAEKYGASVAARHGWPLHPSRRTSDADDHEPSRTRAASRRTLRRARRALAPRPALRVPGARSAKGASTTGRTPTLTARSSTWGALVLCWNRSAHWFGRSVPA